MLSDLKELGVHELLLKAAAVMKERGLARQFTIDPETGEVDAEGALLVALDAGDIVGLIARPVDRVASNRAAMFQAAVDYLDASCPTGFIWEWTDLEIVTTETVVRLMLDGAFEIAASVVPSEQPDTSLHS